MKYIYILENDSKFRDEMVEAIRKIDSKLAVNWFDSLEEFAKWIREVMVEGPAAIAKGGTPVDGNPPPTANAVNELTLIITKNEFLGAKDLALLKKTRELFITKKLCTAEDPTSLVITSFESPNFAIKLLEDRIINNVIYKPFDKLILQQHLAFAISGRHLPSQYSVHNMKTSATIEMLKEVEIDALSDVGFVTSSNRPIEVGSLAKYYGPEFLSLKDKSIMALCLRCDPHPEISDFFQCSFTYLGADPYQISNIRKSVRDKKATEWSYEWLAPVGPSSGDYMKNVALITLDEELSEHFKKSLETRFENIQVHYFPNLQSFIYAVDHEQAAKDKHVDLTKLPPVPRAFEGIFADSTLFEGDFSARWQSILETVRIQMNAPKSRSEKTDLYVLTKKPFTDSEERELGTVVKDIFFLPMDPGYISRKLCVFIPGLQTKESMPYLTVGKKHIAKVANPIEISEFSEAGLVLKYHRPISIGAFREFVLFLPNELDLPEILASSNFHEENKNEKGVIFNHFVFFGMNDHYLRHIRRWILKNHVDSKESESA
jgi:hypothetical protein